MSSVGGVVVCCSGGGGGSPVVGVGFDCVALSADHSEVVVYDEVVGGVGWDVGAVGDVESEADQSVECDVLGSELL